MKMKNKSTSKEINNNVASQISTLLVNNGIPQHKHRSHVGKILEISYPAARRLLLGDVQWIENDITAVLKSIGIDWGGYQLFPKHPAPDCIETVQSLEMPLDAEVTTNRAEAEAIDQIIDLFQKIGVICANEGVVLNPSKIGDALRMATKDSTQENLKLIVRLARQ